MDAAAKKWIQEYKKLFDQVAARNAGMNVVEDMTTVEKKEEIKRIGKLVDEMGGTATQVPKKVIKKIGKLVPDENAESNKKTASGTKVQDSGERFAILTEPNSKNKFVAIEPKSVKELNDLKGESLSAKVRNYLKQFRGTVLPLGTTDRAYMRREAEGEYTNPAKLLSVQDYEGKLNAAAEFENLLSAATFLRHEADNGRHSDAVRGWNYYELTYVVPVSETEIRAYSGEIQIKLIERGDCFYDITKIRDITNGTAGQALIKAAGSVYDTSISSISQKTQNSNSSGKNSSKDFDSGERNALPDAKKTDKTIAKSEEKLAKKEIRLKAEYETDTVFSESGVKKRLATIDGYKALPASERGDIESRIWTELNESNGYDAREWLRLKWSVRLIDELVSQRGEAISRAERDIISKQVNQAIDGIVDSGRKSVRGRMEGEIRAELSDKIRNEATAKERIRSEIYQTLKKIEDKKTARKNVPLILSVFH